MNCVSRNPNVVPSDYRLVLHLHCMHIGVEGILSPKSPATKIVQAVAGEQDALSGPVSREVSVAELKAGALTLDAAENEHVWDLLLVVVFWGFFFGGCCWWVSLFD